MSDKKLFEEELDFTETFKKFKEAHPALREIMCLKTLFKNFFCEIKEGDLFAGRVKYGFVGFGLETTTAGSLYYCKRKSIKRIADCAELEDGHRKKIQEMLDFWAKEAFIDHEGDNPDFGVMPRSLPADILEATSNTIANMGGRLAGSCINFDKLIRLGIPGLMAEIEECRQISSEVEIYDVMLLALETLKENLKRYSLQARELSVKAANEGWKKELLEMAAVLDKLTASKPETMREAMQLMWMYALTGMVVNYGRMDEYLGDLYVRDIESGIITEEKALELAQSLWRLMVARRIAAHEPSEFNARIIIGGLGRRNVENADKFALLAMEASRTVIETEPQLSLRIYKGMNPDLMKKALDVIGEGRVYPMLYNDDVNVPAVAKAFNVSIEDAEQYIPYGCGEYALDHIAIGSPNCSLNLLKALEAALHDGRDMLTGKRVGLITGSISEFDTFDKLFDAYKKQVEYFTEALARRHAIEYEVENKMASFLYVSMLYDDCIRKGKSVVGGGARYTGGIIETFGMVNTADSLTAIKELVYDKKLMTLEELVRALDSNYEGFAKEHRLMLEASKYGNDNENADSMLQHISQHSGSSAQNMAGNLGFDYYLIVNINNSSNIAQGKLAAASADGRKDRAPLANGNTPTAGMDKNGVTAFLNSLSKVTPERHAGYSHNMKFSKQLFNRERPKLEALLNTYFAKGGTQAMITVVNRGDLENAMKEPEKYHNLIVRVGGFSARFVELDRDVQIDILNRTLY